MGLLRKEDFPARDDPFAPFDSAFYSGVFFEQGQFSAEVQNRLASLPRRAQVSWGRSSRSAIARIGTTIGVPQQWIKATADNPLGEIGALLDVDLDQFRNFDENTIREVVERGAYLVYGKLLSLVGTAQPIVGALAQFALFVVEVVQSSMAEVAIDERRNEYQWPAMAYNREADEDYARDIITRLSSIGGDNYDLTPLFLPARIPRRIQDIIPGSGHTVRGPYGPVVRIEGDPNPDAFGGVPAMSEIAGTFQYSQYGTGNNVAVGRGAPETFGQSKPASVQLMATLWQTVIKNSPMAFRIDGWKIADAWERYYKVLIDWAISAPGTDTAKRHRWAMISQIACWARLGYQPYGGNTTPLFDPYWPEPGGAGRGQWQSDPCPKGSKCVPKEYVQWRGMAPQVLWADRGPLVRWLIEEQWAKRLKRFLGTITCAYVPPDAPALRHPQLRQYHRAMRERLLRHDAKYLVDQSMIRDAAYRSKMRTATLSPTGQVKAALTPEQRGRLEALTIGALPIVDVDLVVDDKVVALANPTGDQLAIQHVDLPELEGLSGAAVAVLAVAIGVPAVWAIWRYQRRRRMPWR